LTTFSAAAHQNVFLPRGSSEVDAILSVSAREGESSDWNTVALGGSVEVIMVDSSGSMTFPSSKIEAARTATGKAIDRLRDGTWFAVIAGSTQARMIYPEPAPGPDGYSRPQLASASISTRAAAKQAVGKLEAGFRADAFNYLLVLRLVPVFPFWLVNLVPALVGVGLPTYMLATFLGILPGTFVYASLGNGLGSLVEEPDLAIIFKPSVLLPIIGLALLALVPVGYKRWRGRKPV